MPASTRGHREIEHTADLGFEVWAPDVAGLFAESVQALAELCYQAESVEPREERPLRVEGMSSEELLVRWLQSIYLWLEGDAWLAADAVEVAVENGGASGVIRGEPLDRRRHLLHTEIKAVTYHGLEIEHLGGRWRTTVIVDV